jgi:hypothetical protein
MARGHFTMLLQSCPYCLVTRIATKHKGFVGINSEQLEPFSHDFLQLLETLFVALIPNDGFRGTFLPINLVQL